MKKRFSLSFAALGLAFRCLWNPSSIKRIVPINVIPYKRHDFWEVDDPEYFCCNFDSEEKALAYIDEHGARIAAQLEKWLNGNSITLEASA
jgi:hypothetical protein